MVKEQMAEMYPIDPVLKTIEKTLRGGHHVWIVGQITYMPPDTVPVLLGPAPYDPAGWNETLYRETWEAQVGYLLQRNAAVVEEVPVAPGTRIVPQEKAQLIMASGWKPAAR